LEWDTTKTIKNNSSDDANNNNNPEGFKKADSNYCPISSNPAMFAIYENLLCHMFI